MIILGIETSFDETSVAIIQDGTTFIRQHFSTSMAKHAPTGGVVPEIASREQAIYIIPVLQQVLSIPLAIIKESNQPQPSQANSTSNHTTQATAATNLVEWAPAHSAQMLNERLPEDPLQTLQIHNQNPQPKNTQQTITYNLGIIDALAVTVGPGLVGSLLIGVETAKTLAYAWNKPLIPVNHMLGHIYGAWLTYGTDMDKLWPKLALLASGGHTELILMHSHQHIQKIGWTLDDAAGEAFDKVGRLLGLPYPGGPKVSLLAQSGNPNAIPFPLPMPQKDNFNFSFSGLKTAVLHYIREHPQADKADIAASFQHAVVTSLINKTKHAAQHYDVKEVILGGGVAANTLLREQLVNQLHPLPVRIPDLAYTTDNAGVIAAAAFYHQNFTNWQEVQANPSLEILK